MPASPVDPNLLFAHVVVGGLILYEYLSLPRPTRPYIPVHIYEPLSRNRDECRCRCQEPGDCSVTHAPVKKFPVAHTCLHAHHEGLQHARGLRWPGEMWTPLVENVPRANPGAAVKVNHLAATLASHAHAVSAEFHARPRCVANTPPSRAYCRVRSRTALDGRSTHELSQ